MMFCVIDSPIGHLRIREENSAIVEINLTKEKVIPASSALLIQASQELREYFDGTRRVFTIPIHYEGTPFRCRCWDALRTIPYGETRSYGQQAALVGNPKATRAVGGANHHNRLLIVVPCHRVIGADGSLTGFGGGIHVKAWLLAHEKQHMQ